MPAYRFLVSKFFMCIFLNINIKQGRPISSTQMWGVVCYTASYSSKLNSQKLYSISIYCLNYSPSCLWHVKHLWHGIEIPGTQAMCSQFITGVWAEATSPRAATSQSWLRLRRSFWETQGPDDDQLWFRKYPESLAGTQTASGTTCFHPTLFSLTFSPGQVCSCLPALPNIPISLLISSHNSFPPKNSLNLILSWQLFLRGSDNQSLIPATSRMKNSVPW